VPPKYIYRDATTCAQYAATLESRRCQRGRPGGPPHSPPRRWLTDGAVTLSLDPPMGLAEWRWGQVILIVGLWACCSCWSAQLFLLGFRSGLSADGSGWRGYSRAVSDRVAPQGKPVFGQGQVGG
jgi:hypothetical protein